MGRCELAPTTAVLAHAQAKYSKRFRTAYGPHRLRAEAPYRTFCTKSPERLTDRRPATEPPLTDTSVAGRRHGDFRNRSRVRTHAQSPAEIESSRARVLYMTGGHCSPATVLRAANTAPQSKRRRFLANYGIGQHTVHRLAHGKNHIVSVSLVGGVHGHFRAPIAGITCKPSRTCHSLRQAARIYLERQADGPSSGDSL